MDEKDLINILLENREVDEVIEIADEILDLVDKNPKIFISNIRDVLIDVCKELDKCPSCGQDLEVIESYEESRGEYWGAPVYENIYIYGCSNCNYTEE